MTTFNVLFFDEDEVEHDCVVRADDAASALGVVLDEQSERIADDSPFAVYPVDPPAELHLQPGASTIRAAVSAQGPRLTACARSTLEAWCGADQVWDEAGLAAELARVGIDAPVAARRRRRDGEAGMLMFRDGPRPQLDCTPDRPWADPDGEDG